MSMSMEQVVTQLQQEVFNLQAQVTAESGLADAVRAINNLVTPQVRKDILSLIDVKGLGRPKEFTGREEDFQQWSKKTGAVFAGLIKESEMMLELAAEQPTKSRRQRLISISCRRMRTRIEECETWSLCCSRCTQHSWLSRVMKQSTLSPTPPLEAVKVLVSIMMSVILPNKGKPLKLRHYGISRAHFQGTAQRPIYIKLQADVRQKYSEDKVGRLI